MIDSRRPGDSAEHAAEYQGVEGEDRVPVGEACDAGRLEDRRLAQARAPGFGRHLELQPCVPRQAHLCAEKQQPVGFEADDAPAVDGVAHRELVAMPPSPSISINRYFPATMSPARYDLPMDGRGSSPPRLDTVVFASDEANRRD